MAVAEAWKKELQEVKKAAEEIPDPTPPSSGQPLDYAPNENRPGGATRSGGSSGSKPAAPQVISDTDAYKIGISAAAAPSYLTDGDIQVDRDGRRWKYRQKDNRWVAQFHGGGLVGPEGGEAHEGEVVLNKSTVQKYGASNLLALQTTAAVPAAVAAALPTTSAAPGNVAVTADAPMVEVLLRILAALSQPGANNDMVAWLQAIEANTRRPAAGPSVESVQARTGAFV